MALQLFKIETVEVASPVTSVTFSNIPQGYTDLKLVFSTRDNTESYVLAEFNGSSTSYSAIALRGNGSTAASTILTTTRVGISSSTSYTSNTFANNELYIPNYTSSNYKSISSDGASENNSTTAYSVLAASLWSNTAAITSIRVFPNTGYFQANSTFTLYGVL